MPGLRWKASVLLLAAALAGSGCCDAVEIALVTGAVIWWAVDGITGGPTGREAARREGMARQAFEDDFDVARFHLFRQSAEDRLEAARALARHEERARDALPWLMGAVARETDPRVAREMMRTVRGIAGTRGCPRGAGQMCPPPLVVASVRGQGREVFALEGEGGEHADAASLAAAIAVRIPRGSAAMVRLRLDGVEPSPSRTKAILAACRGRVGDVEEIAGPVVRPRAADAVPVLVEALRDEDPGVRAVAAWALGWIGPEAREAVPALYRATGDTDRVRGAARAALKRIQSGR